MMSSTMMVCCGVLPPPRRLLFSLRWLLLLSFVMVRGCSGSGDNAGNKNNRIQHHYTQQQQQNNKLIADSNNSNYIRLRVVDDDTKAKPPPPPPPPPNNNKAQEEQKDEVSSSSSSSSVEEAFGRGGGGRTTKKPNPLSFTYQRKRGRITLNFNPQNQREQQRQHLQQLQLQQQQNNNRLLLLPKKKVVSPPPPPPPPFSDSHLGKRTTLTKQREYRRHPSDSAVSVSVDPQSVLRFAGVALKGVLYFGDAFVGTLRLLAPLIFARRVLNFVGDQVVDYMTGRYLRTTYRSIERQYWKPYQVPAVLRSVGRAIVHVFVLVQVGNAMESVIGLNSRPCVLQHDVSCRWWCGMLWIIVVVGVGEACGLAMEIYGGPLKIKAAPSTDGARTSRSRIFTRPHHILHLLKDPDQWISQITTIGKQKSNVFYVPEETQGGAGGSGKQFTPDPMLFPATWKPLRGFLFLAVAKAMSSITAAGGDVTANSFSRMHLLMRQFLIQNAFTDEWYRVFMEEKRIILGVCANFCNLVATTVLFVHVFNIDRASSVLMAPMLLAVVFSTWMNILIYWEKRLAARGNRDNKQSVFLLFPVKDSSEEKKNRKLQKQQKQLQKQQQQQQAQYAISW